MPVYQSQSNGQVAFKVQSAIGTQSSGAGATVLRTTGGTGGRLTKASTVSNEIRRDGMSVRGRHGTYKTNGAWTGELSVGSHEAVMEATMRDTWGSSNLTATAADFTTVTTTASTIVWASGDPRVKIKVGDVIRLTNQDAGNNSKNLRVTALSSTAITVAETLVVNAGALAATITIPGKRLIQYSASTLVKRYYTVEEYDIDIDQSEILTDFVFGSFRLAMAPNGLISLDPGGVGTGRFETFGTTAAPLFTSPSTSTGTVLSVVDATIRTGGADLVDLTSLDMTFDLAPAAPDVFGSGAIKYSPDVFTGQATLMLNMTVLRPDLQFVLDFTAETAYQLHILAVENTSEPKAFVSFFVPNFTLGSVDKSALAKAGGPRTQTVAVPAALCGIDNTGTGYDATMLKIQSTGA